IVHRMARHVGAVVPNADSVLIEYCRRKLVNEGQCFPSCPERSGVQPASGQAIERSGNGLTSSGWALTSGWDCVGPTPTENGMAGPARLPRSGSAKEFFPMSSQPRRSRLEVEDIGDVTVVNFVDRKILDEQNIQIIGQQLFSLVDELGRRKVLLNFQ